MPHNTRYTEPVTRVYIGTAAEIEYLIASRHDMLTARIPHFIAPERAAECIAIKQAVNREYTRTAAGLLQRKAQP